VRASVLYRGAWYALNIGQYGVAEKMGQTSLVAREEIQGLDHADTLNSMSNLIGVLRDQGRYEQVEEMN